jgi:hypothetical protein
VYCVWIFIVVTKSYYYGFLILSPLIIFLLLFEIATCNGSHYSRRTFRLVLVFFLFALSLQRQQLYCTQFILNTHQCDTNNRNVKTFNSIFIFRQYILILFVLTYLFYVQSTFRVHIINLKDIILS